MKNKYFVILVLVIFNIVLAYQLLSARKEKSLLAASIVNEDVLRDQLLHTISLDETELNLMDLSKNERPIICYYASDIHCNSCVDSVLKTINSISEEYDGVNITLLAKYKNKNDLNIFLRQNRFNGNVLDVNNVSSLVFESNYPLMFVYHPNRNRVSEILRPAMSDMETTRKYLHIIFEKYSRYQIEGKNANSLE